MSLSELVTATEAARQAFRSSGTECLLGIYLIYYVRLGQLAYDPLRMKCVNQHALEAMKRLAINQP